MTTNDERIKMAKIMNLLVLDQWKVHYKEVRPMATRSIRSLAQLKYALTSNRGITMDCSEAITLICKLAGINDPNGLHYDGQGYTGTLLKHLPHYHDPSLAKIGALVVFGPNHGDHVCMVRQPGKNPTLFSHGQERDPIYISLSAERKFHRPPVTFLSIAKL
jgi:hypothetical protein